MRKVILICIALFFSLATQANERYFVTASNGLIVRDGPNVNATRIGKMPYGTVVILLETNNSRFQIIDNEETIKGEWFKVSFVNSPYRISEINEEYNSDGYVFSGYLEKMHKITSLKITEIDQSTFDNLYKKVDHKNIDKISSQYEVEKLLGLKLKWKAKENGKKLIDTITLANKKVLTIIHHDPYPLEFIAYFPDEEIVLFSEGETNDVPISIKTGESGTIGNPEFIINSPSKKRRLNGYSANEKCIEYFFEEKKGASYNFISSFSNGKILGSDVCYIRQFYWISDTDYVYSGIADDDFIYNKPVYLDQKEKYFKGSFK